MITASFLRISMIITLMMFCGMLFLKAQDNAICLNPDIKPLFPGGNAALVKFIKDNVKYPAEADSAHVKGTVCVSFIVEKSGGHTNINIAEGIGKGCDEEAMRVIRKMPK